MKTLFLSLALTGVVSLQAGPITYSVVVNTSSISGTTGNLDFQFNPGNATSQAASALISGFSSNGVPGTPAVLTGAVTPNNAQLPGSFTLNNTQAFNDLFQPFTFGSTFSFLITLSGPALNTPNGTATAGSTFAISLYNAAGNTPLLTSDPSGAVGTIDINLNGSTTASTFQNFDAPPVASITVSGVPEPGTLLLLSLGMGAMVLRKVTRS